MSKLTQNDTKIAEWHILAHLYSGQNVTHQKKQRLRKRNLAKSAEGIFSGIKVAENICIGRCLFY